MTPGGSLKLTSKCSNKFLFECKMVEKTFRGIPKKANLSKIEVSSDTIDSELWYFHYKISRTF